MKYPSNLSRNVHQIYVVILDLVGDDKFRRVSFVL